MFARLHFRSSVLVALVSASFASVWAAGPFVPKVIICPAGASSLEQLAAKEVRRYIYLRTDTLLPISRKLEPVDGCIILGTGQSDVFAGLGGISLRSFGPEEYILKTVTHGNRKNLLIVGGSPVGVLYGAYRFAEHLGVRFYMHGDVIPDEKIALAIGDIDEHGKPLFNLRGIQPFHDFPEGPDWWSIDDYKAILSQLPKMRMNFFALHTYPEGGVGPEPAVWIGPEGEFDNDGNVTASYPSSWQSTQRGNWGYAPKKISDYSFGSDGIFAGDVYGSQAQPDMIPWPEGDQQNNQVFNRAAAMLKEAFTHARSLGIKTCVGTETPLTIPKTVSQRLKKAGKDPADLSVVQQVYEGMFKRITKAYPLDYYWFWTPEGWTWSGTKPEQVKATVGDLKAAIAAAKNVDAPFTLATCGWVLGPPDDRALFDKTLPREMPLSCINRNVGFAPVEVGFADVKDRPIWSIPWMEDDPALIIPQLWVGRMRRDAADSLAYGCTGLMGIHWRTRILGPNVSALAKAAWQGGCDLPAPTAGGDGPRDLPTEDFYIDWARSQFGSAAAESIAKLFVRLDGGYAADKKRLRNNNLPRPSDWVRGPGGIKPDPRPWEQVKNDYRFVEEMQRFRLLIKGPGNRERFDYWLNNFRYIRAVGGVNCTWARFNEAMKKVKAEKDDRARKKLAEDLALPIRKELIAQVAQVHKYLLATITTAGGMGNVTNWQQHLLGGLLEKPGKELAKILGRDLPADAMPSKEYTGPVRMFVPTARTSINAGEKLKLKAILLGAEAKQAAVHYRPMGAGKFSRKKLGHLGRGVYSVSLPADAIASDTEYYVQIVTDSGEKLRFPATAPAINQTVVVTQAR